MHRATSTEEALLERYAERFAPAALERDFTFAEGRELYLGLERLHRRFDRAVRISDSYQAQLKQLAEELQAALARVRSLKGTLSICSSCKQIRDDEQGWLPLEAYIRQHSGTLFSHGICPECAQRLYSEYLPKCDHGAPGAEKKAAPNQIVSVDDLDDPGVKRFLPLTQDRLLAKNPLHGDLKELFQRYLRLVHRVRRIAEISDRYHADFRRAWLETEWLQRTDALTGVFNRRALMEKLEQARLAVVPEAGSYALFRVDIAGLAGINRRHEFDGGDQVLRAVAEVLRSVVGEAGLVGRWDGDEFAVLAGPGDKRQMLTMAGRLAESLGALRVAVGGVPVEVKLRLGCAQARLGDSVIAWYERAAPERSVG